MKCSMIKTTAVAAMFTAAATFSASTFAETKLIGSGASFPFPIYSKWFKDFSSQNDNVRIDYQAKGSGGGIKDFISGAVDFAASDAAMKDDELAEAAAAGRKAVLLPMTAGEVVLAYNLDGVNSLNLPRDVYPAIFTGEISKWNDPKISAANPGVELPNKDITVVVRADSSGTTYVYTSHLSAINDEFKEKIGTAKSPQWPKSDRFIKAPKNDGITATIKQTPGSIGYIEYGYAKLTGWKQVASLENKEGKFVAPGPESGAAALAGADFPTGNLPNSDVPNLIAWATDPAGEASYPIASYTWMLFYTSQDKEKAKALREMVEYGLTEGQKIADSMGYIPLPEEVVEKVREAATHIE